MGLYLHRGYCVLRRIWRGICDERWSKMVNQQERPLLSQWLFCLSFGLGPVSSPSGVTRPREFLCMHIPRNFRRGKCWNTKTTRMYPMLCGHKRRPRTFKDQWIIWQAWFLIYYHMNSVYQVVTTLQIRKWIKEKWHEGFILSSSSTPQRVTKFISRWKWQLQVQ